MQGCDRVSDLHLISPQCQPIERKKRKGKQKIKRERAA